MWLLFVIKPRVVLKAELWNVSLYLRLNIADTIGGCQQLTFMTRYEACVASARSKLVLPRGAGPIGGVGGEGVAGPIGGVGGEGGSGSAGVVGGGAAGATTATVSPGSQCQSISASQLQASCYTPCQCSH